MTQYLTLQEEVEEAQWIVRAQEALSTGVEGVQGVFYRKRLF